MKKGRWSKHHVIPSSRCRRLGKKPEALANIRYKRNHIHKGFHNLFGNCCPWETIKLLELLKEVFGDKTTSQMIEEVRRKWS